MPSGKTHDKITLYSIPIVAPIGVLIFQEATAVLSLVSSFTFAGLMFGPDLDLKSCQYYRWKILRWIWIPYQKAMHHRSFWSHGLIAGTAIRVVYLLVWFISLGCIGVAIVCYLTPNAQFTWMERTQGVFTMVQTTLFHSVTHHPKHWSAIALGLEAGAMSHSVADWIVSTFKRLRKRLRA